MNHTPKTKEEVKEEVERYFRLFKIFAMGQENFPRMSGHIDLLEERVLKVISSPEV